MSEEKHKLEGWCVGILRKRTPDALTVLSHLLKAGLERGQCSAQDVPDNSGFDEPRIIGAVFKMLPCCGFFKDRSQYVKMERARCHGREVPVWVLEERWKAEYILAKLRNAFFTAEPTGQGMLTM